jgi:hypothetical protein
VTPARLEQRPAPVNDGLLQASQILCVDFTCLQVAQGPSATTTVARWPRRARAETTASGAIPILRERHIAQRATPRIASDTASASVLMTDTVPAGGAGPTVDFGPRSLPEPMNDGLRQAFRAHGAMAGQDECALNVSEHGPHVRGGDPRFADDACHTQRTVSCQKGCDLYRHMNTDSLRGRMRSRYCRRISWAASRILGQAPINGQSRLRQRHAREREHLADVPHARQRSLSSWSTGRCSRMTRRGIPRPRVLSCSRGRRCTEGRAGARRSAERSAPRGRAWPSRYMTGPPPPRLRPGAPRSQSGASCRGRSCVRPKVSRGLPGRRRSAHRCPEV